MLGWRKRDQGFEWRKYVRTTILVRRGRRKERIEEAREAAVQGLKQAGRRGVDAGSAGLSSAGDWMKRGVDRGGDGVKRGLAAAGGGLRRGLGRAGAGLKGGLSAIGPRLAPAGRAMAGAARPGIAALGQPGITLSLALVAVVCAAAAGLRIATKGLDGEAAVPMAVAALCGALLAVSRLGDVKRLAAWLRLPVAAGRTVAAAAGVLALVATAAAGTWWWQAGWWQAGPRGAVALATRPAAVQSAVPATAAAGSGRLHGRAIVRSGDTLRLAGATVHLEGIEAPLPDQVCTRATGRRWKCGQAAKDALTRLVRGKSVSCEVGQRDEAGRAGGHCQVNGADIAAELVRHGNVFAEQGIFARYGSLEGEARAAGTGVWSGEAERPEDYRSKLWEDAKKSAPEGCPIKALVSSEGRVYLLPWSRTYERTKVRSGRGERWFCSEAEAQAAGWRPNDRS